MSIKQFDFMTVRECSEETGIPRAVLYELIKNKVLKATRLSDRRTLVNRTNLEEMIMLHSTLNEEQ